MPRVVEFSQHLLVDGYNIVHAWPEMRRLLTKEGRDVARGRLVERLRVLHDFERIRVSIVFDGRGADIAIERPTPHTTFSVLYTPAGMTADDLIEQLTVQSATPGAVSVATADQAERDTIEAAGAHALLPEQLAAWVARAERAQGAALGEHQRQVESQWRKRDRS
ncbi:MAG TPA: NYN domain-containing protein [Opitutaceae bacterium]|nr:NYN domain-containing protein [Opitutaceae bacterium]